MKTWVLFIAMAASAADSAIVGTWSLRVARSDMRPTQLVSENVAITQKDAVTWHYVYDFEFKDGRKTHNEQDRIFDGKERPVAEGTVEVGKHPDAHNWISQRFKDGKMIDERHSTISADGKTQTVQRTTVTATETGSQTIRESIVFERQ